MPGSLAAAVYVLLARGALTLDLNIGRRIRPLGPQTVTIDAPAQTVFDVISAPYLGRTPHAMQDKLHVLERSSDAVLADHRTQAGPFTTSTVEVVVFERPHRVRFHLVRGPVPHVVEEFNLTEPAQDRTVLVYTGELGTDLWALGALWGRTVARHWEATVATSLAEVRAEAERRSAKRR